VRRLADAHDSDAALVFTEHETSLAKDALCRRCGCAAITATVRSSALTITSQLTALATTNRTAAAFPIANVATHHIYIYGMSAWLATHSERPQW
jgi:hypothetical protein